MRTCAQQISPQSSVEATSFDLFKVSLPSVIYVLMSHWTVFILHWVVPFFVFVFLVAGGANPPGGGTNIQIWQIFPKKCMKLGKFWFIEGGVLGAPPWIRHCAYFSLLFLPPANEVCECYVFTGVCLSTKGCAWRGHAWLEGHAWWGAYVAGGHAWQGVHMAGGAHGKGHA